MNENVIIITDTISNIDINAKFTPESLNQNQILVAIKVGMANTCMDHIIQHWTEYFDDTSNIQPLRLESLNEIIYNLDEEDLKLTMSQIQNTIHHTIRIIYRRDVTQKHFLEVTIKRWNDFVASLDEFVPENIHTDI